MFFLGSLYMQRVLHYDAIQIGLAFLPVAIGYLIGGRLGGYLVHYFGDVLHRPAEMWWVISAIGFATTLLMWIYNMVFKPVAAADSPPAA